MQFIPKPLQGWLGTGTAWTTAYLLLSLLAFNVGIELGQLAVLALVWPVLAWLRTRFARHGPFRVARSLLSRREPARSLNRCSD